MRNLRAGRFQEPCFHEYEFQTPVYEDVPLANGGLTDKIIAVVYGKAGVTVPTARQFAASPHMLEALKVALAQIRDKKAAEDREHERKAEEYGYHGQQYSRPKGPSSTELAIVQCEAAMKRAEGRE